MEEEIIEDVELGKKERVTLMGRGKKLRKKR